MAAHSSSAPVLSQAANLSDSIQNLHDEARRVEATLSSANLATVMGPASKVGQLSEENAKRYLGGDATIMSLIKDLPNADAIISRLGQLGSGLSFEISEAVSKQAQQLVQVQVADRANDESAKMVSAACEAQRVSKELTASSVCLATGVSAARTTAQT
jgi:predicted RND superfamily exporter protein